MVRFRSWTSSKIAADARQFGIVLEPAGEHPLGEHLDPRRRPDAPLVAGLVADEPADVPPVQLGHPPARRGSPGGAVRARRSAVAAPRLVEQGERYERGLAGAGAR